MNWVRVKQHGDQGVLMEPRAGHVAVIDDRDSMIVFGGYNRAGYMDSRYLAVNFDQREVRDFVYQQTKRQAEIKRAKIERLNTTKSIDTSPGQVSQVDGFYQLKDLDTSQQSIETPFDTSRRSSIAKRKKGFKMRRLSSIRSEASKQKEKYNQI